MPVSIPSYLACFPWPARGISPLLTSDAGGSFVGDGFTVATGFFGVRVGSFGFFGKGRTIGFAG